MSSRLRTGTKPGMGFFAFQDIITSVTGVLILVTLILASHLELASDAPAQETADTLEGRLSTLLEEQTRLELENRSLNESLKAAQAQPDAVKLDEDITGLQSQIEDEQRRLSAIRAQSDLQRQKVRQRDVLLGLSGIHDEVEKRRAETTAIATKDRTRRAEREGLEEELKRAQTALLTAKSRLGQLWLIPDDEATTKDPVLAVVAHDGVTLEQFDKPESRRVISAAKRDDFRRLLTEYNADKQYIVFYVRPSGISLFNQLSEQAKGAGYEIGFDALEETTAIHFARPPALDDLPLGAPEAQSKTNTAGAPATTRTSESLPPPKTLTTNAPTSTSPATPTQPKLSWWRRLLRAVGLL
jgi:hypothetical protein